MGRPKKEKTRSYKPQLEDCPLPVLDFINKQVKLGGKLLSIEVCETDYTRGYLLAMCYPPGEILGIMSYRETLDGMELAKNCVFTSCLKLMEWGRKALDESEVLKRENKH